MNDQELDDNTLTWAEIDLAIRRPRGCPKCHDHSIDRHDDGLEDNVFWMVLACANCGLWWEETYTLTDIQPCNQGPLKTQGEA